MCSRHTRTLPHEAYIQIGQQTNIIECQALGKTQGKAVRNWDGGVSAVLARTVTFEQRFK